MSWPAGRPIVVLWYKVCNCLWCHACMKFAPPFFPSRLSNVCWSHISLPLCSKLWYCYVEVFLTSESCWITTHILTVFSITFLTQFVKKRPCSPWSFLGLSSNVIILLSSCSLIVQTSLTIWQFLWLNGENTVKIDAWAVAQTVYAFSFTKE